MYAIDCVTTFTRKAVSVFEGVATILAVLVTVPIAMITHHHRDSDRTDH